MNIFSPFKLFVITSYYFKWLIIKSFIKVFINLSHCMNFIILKFIIYKLRCDDKTDEKYESLVIKLNCKTFEFFICNTYCFYTVNHFILLMKYTKYFFTKARLIWKCLSAWLDPAEPRSRKFLIIRMCRSEIQEKTFQK